ncbi:MAG: hypothetical protein J7K23_00975 [Thermoproteales archaeon]|nr:hypothetical protein [Thermoproteales archaeon]
MSEIRFKAGIADLVEYLDPDIELNHIELATISIIGSMGSGKTTLAKTLAAYIEESRNTLTLYGHELVAALDFLDDNLDLLKGVERTFIILDDVSATASWQAVLSKMDNVHQYLKIRHEMRQRGFEHGVVDVLYLIQYVKLLAPVFRSNSGVIIFKTGAFRDRTEKKMLREMLDSDHYYFLKEITTQIMLLHRDDYKRYFVASWINGQNDAYDSENEILEPENFYDFTQYERIEEELLELILNGNWKSLPKRIRILLLANTIYILYNMNYGHREIKNFLRELGFTFDNNALSTIIKTIQNTEPRTVML